MPARSAGVSSMGEMILTKPFFRADFHAQSAEFAGGVFFEVGVVFFVHEFGMGVEAGYHAFHRAFEQCFVGFVFVVVGFDLAVHFGQGADGLHGQRVLSFPPRCFAG